MKTLKPTLIVLTVALVAMGAVVESGRAEERATSDRPARARTQMFSVAGSYSGVLSGELMLSGRSVFIPDNAMLYDVEDGILEPGSVVTASSISVSGTINQAGDLVASIIIVSRDEGSDYSTMTMPNMIAPAGRPR